MKNARFMSFAAAVLTLVMVSHPASAQGDGSRQTVELLGRAIGQLGQLLNRDVVVVDSNQTIIADKVAEEIGTRFDHDVADEVGQSLKDGRTRTFKEVSKAYPQGITLQVVPIRGKGDDVIGALIFQP